jgi:hypothetical protein
MYDGGAYLPIILFQYGTGSQSHLPSSILDTQKPEEIHNPGFLAALNASKHYSLLHLTEQKGFIANHTA